MVKSSDIKREVLSKRLAELTEQYVVIQEELSSSLDKAEQLRLNRKIDILEQDMLAVDNELVKLDTTLEQNSNIKYLAIEKSLLNIDFVDAKEIFEHKISKLGANGGAALFLIQNSHSMRGQLLISEIRNRLSQRTNNFRYFPMALSATMRPNETGILNGLGGYLNVAPISDLKLYIEAIINKICEIIHGETTILFEFRKWDNLYPQEHYIKWFINMFWTPLVHKLSKIYLSHQRFHLVAFIVFDKKLKPELLDESYYCTEEDFDSTKICELPLQNWTKEDIQYWLYSFTGLADSQVDLIAKQVYRASRNGIPDLVCDALMEQLM